MATGNNDTYTTHYNLLKPGYGSSADINQINDNMDVIDEQLYLGTREMVGSGTLENGVPGQVPMPLAGNADRYLRCDGRWMVPPGSGGGGGGSAGIYAISATIAVTDWSANGSSWRVLLTDPVVNTSMNILEWYISDENNILGVTDVTVGDGVVTIITDVKPTASWSIHIDLGANGAQVLQDVIGKPDQATLAYIETGDSVSTPGGIPANQYLYWMNNLYVTNTTLPYGTEINSSSLSSTSGGGLNNLANSAHSMMGIIQDGDTATVAISKGKYVIWKGTLSLTTVDISMGDTLSVSNLTTVQGGGFNNSVLTVDQSLSDQQKKKARDNIGADNLYGLSYDTMIEIPANTNLDNITTCGSYYSPTSGRTQTLTNVPFTNSGFSLHVESVAGGTGAYKVQTINRYLGGTYKRSYNGTDTWTDWGSYIMCNSSEEVGFTRIVAQANTSVTFNLSNTYRGVLFCGSTTTGGNGMMFVTSTNEGNVNYDPAYGCTLYTYNTSVSNKLTISTTGYSVFMLMTIRGSASV